MARILVAEDDDPLRQLLGTMLTAAGHDVLTAANGAEALTLAETCKPDLLITDYVMPLVDGAQLTITLHSRATMQSLPVIMYTAYSSDPTLRHLIDQEPEVHYVAKGYPMRELLTQVRRLAGAR